MPARSSILILIAYWCGIFHRAVVFSIDAPRVIEIAGIHHGPDGQNSIMSEVFSTTVDTHTTFEVRALDVYGNVAVLDTDGISVLLQNSNLGQMTPVNGSNTVQISQGVGYLTFDVHTPGKYTASIQGSANAPGTTTALQIGTASSKSPVQGPFVTETTVTYIPGM